MRRITYSKLRGRIVEKYGSQINFAKAMGMSETTLSYRMTGKLPWSQDEMVMAMDLLAVPIEEVADYFFCLDSSKM